MRHVGYVHSHLPQAVAEPPYGQCVVEVLGVVRVDGAREGLPEVLPLLQILLCYLARYLVGGVLHSLGILVGQSVLCEDGVHLDVVVARRTEHVCHLSYHVTVVAVGPLHYPHHRLVAVLASFKLAARYYDACRQGAVLRYEVGDVAVGAQPSHESVLGALYYLYHLSLFYVVPPARHDRHPHPVSRQRPHGVALRNEYWCLAVVGYERVLSVLLALERALLHLPFRIEPVGVVAHFGEEVVPCHLLHDVYCEHLQRVCVEVQGAEYLLETECLVRL